MSGDAPAQMAETPLPEQLPELLQFRCWGVVARETRRMLEMRDYREERCTLMMWCTEIAQMMMRLFAQPLGQCRGHARLAYPGFAREQHGLALSVFCAVPSSQQKFELFHASN